MAERALDIFTVLRNIDLKNRDFFTNLTEEERKGFAPVVVMQWLTCGTQNDELQNILINEYVNKYVFNLYKHPDLLYRLMVCCSTGTPQFYKWTKSAKKENKYPKSVALLQRHFSCSTKRAIEMLTMVPNDELLMLACDYGYQADDYKALQKELKNRE